MSTVYRTKIEGEMLDLICFNHYQSRSRGVVEKVLEANTNREDLRTLPRLPFGTTIVLPDINDTELAEPIQNLWD